MTLLKFESAKDTMELDLNKATPEEVKLLADKLHFGLVTSLMSSLYQIDQSSTALSNMKDKLIAKVEKKLAIDLEADTLDYDFMLDAITKFADLGIKTAEVKRKVFNGKELLKIDPLTKQERAMMDLLRTVNTPEKKESLVNFVQGLDEFEEEQED